MKTERMQEALGLLEELTKFGMNLGLERIRALLAEFNNPHLSLPVIHLAGTNGKGSTAAMLAAVLDQCGYRVGMFTSPHLVSYTERFTIGGAPISEEDFAALLHEVHGKFQQVQERIGESPTEFETLTAMAFLYFTRRKVDILLLEAGLGGDIDSTNVVERPLLSIITNVSLEHTQYLGKSSAEIAARKSGIIKKNRPVITAAAQEDVLQVIRGKAAEQESALFEVYREMTWQLIEETPDG
ncbi:MAG: Mur ligase family protein, partial [Clostridia bacterium]|nr:Mur ligase family protein [Clostridia bacterium]